MNSVILARILKAEGFGLYNLLLLTASVGSSIGSFGMGVTATRFIANERGRGGQKVEALVHFIVQVAAIMSIFCGMILLAVAPFVAHYVATGQHLERAMALSSLYLVGSSLDLVMMGILIGFERFKLLLVTGSVKGMVAIVLCSLMAISEGVSGAILGLGVMSILGAGMNYFAVRSSLPRDRQAGVRISGGECREILRFSFPVMLASLLVNPSTWLGSVLVNRQAGGSVLLAEFSVVRNWMMVLQFFPVQIAQAMLPFLSRRRGTGHLSDHTASLSILLVASIAVVLALGTLPVGWWFVQLYGFESPSLEIGFYVMLAASILAAMNTMIGQIILSRGYSWPRLFADLSISVTFVVGVWLLLPQHRQIALPVATSLSLLTGTLIIAAFILKTRKSK